MINNFKATILIDNKPNQGRPDLLSEHGLSIWIEADSTTILFDTGQSNKCIDNALQLSVDLKRAENGIHRFHTSVFILLFINSFDKEIKYDTRKYNRY